jgi:hypothetical protein
MRQRVFLSRWAFGVALSAVLAGGAMGVARAASDERVTADPAIAPLVSMHDVSMRDVPQIVFTTLQRRPREMPFLTGVDPRTWLARKYAARFNRYAPYNPAAIPAGYNPDEAFTPSPLVKVTGMADSATICQYFGGCEPPDQALAASPSFVLEGVNTSFAVYSTTGAIKSGFPKNSQHFFGIPNPGTCDPAGPFTSDPRAFYDPVDGRFWVAMLQVEGAFGINRCSEKSTYWIAVSKTGDPTAGWHVYAFDMRFGTTNVADFTQFGFDSSAIYFSGNMFDKSGAAYAYAEVFAASKSAMEAGMPVTAHGLKNIKAGTVLVDTVQPVLFEGGTPAPAGIFVASLDMNSGGGLCFSGCSGINVFAMANPLSTTPTLTHHLIASPTYALPPNADEPGCAGCVATNDTRISGQPVYRNGKITFALTTAVGNNSGVLWGQLQPKYTGSAVTGGTMVQHGIVSFTGDRSAFFGATMTDSAGNMALVFDSSSSSIDPSIYFASRLATDPLGKLQAPVTVKKSSVAYSGSRWGDYEAASYDSSSASTIGNIWLASEYTNGDWATELFKTKL